MARQLGDADVGVGGVDGRQLGLVEAVLLPAVHGRRDHDEQGRENAEHAGVDDEDDQRRRSHDVVNAPQQRDVSYGSCGINSVFLYLFSDYNVDAVVVVLFGVVDLLPLLLVSTL